MNVETYLALTHLASRRKGAWAWIVSLMTTASVALGVAALVVTLSVMTGFREDIQSKILGVQPHVFLLPWGNSLDPQNQKLLEALKSQDEVVAWSPYVSGQLLIGHKGRSSGAVVKGIDPQRELAVVDLKSRLKEGDWKDLSGPAREKPPVIMGQELARALGVRVGDEMWAISPGDLANSWAGVPRVRQLSVRGIIETGYYEWDTSLVLMPLAEAQRFFGVSTGASGMGVRIRHLDRADDVAKKLQGSLGGEALATSWLRMNKNLFSALRLEKKVMFVILILVTVVASFMIVSNLLLAVTQRVKEIGILRAMGASKRCIHKIFMIEGTLMGSVGTAMGLGIGWAVSKLVSTTKLISLPSDVYYIDKLPAKIVWPDVLTVALAAGTITFLATLYPAHRASKLDPLEAIRFG